MTAPIAFCTLVPPGRGHRTHWLAIVVQCPTCGRQHTHGAGRDGTNLGHRIGHCAYPYTAADCVRGYVLVALTADLVQRIGGAA